MTYLQEIRRACAYALDDLAGPYLVLAGATFQSVSSGGLASLASPTPAASRYNGRWILHTSQSSPYASQQRMVRKDSWVPSAGTLFADNGWTPPSLNDQIELTTLFPGDAPPFSGETSYRSLINASLKKLDIGDRITLTIGTGQTYTLPAYVTDESRLVGVYEPAPFGTAPIDASWRRPRVVRDGAANLLILDVPFETASGSLSVDVLRPADSLIAISNSGVFVDSTVGLVNEFDTLSPQIPLTEVVEVVLAEAYRVLDNRRDDNRWAGKFPAQDGIARSQLHYRKSAAPPAPPAQGAAPVAA